MTSVTLRPVTAEEYDALREPSLAEFAADLARAEHRPLDEAHRGRGLGRAAMLAAEDVFRAEGCTRIALNVFGWNGPADALYRSLGFQVDATQLSKPLADPT